MDKHLKIIENRVFFVGVGGVSMSALATLCNSLGIKVAGSDIIKTPETIKLEKLFNVYYEHNKTNIINFKPNLVVYTAAIKLDNPELKFAAQQGIRIMERSKFLGEVCKHYKNVIAVAGTHGKTTTTSMIAEIFIKANLNPTVHVGGDVVNLGGNLVVGGSQFFITEACEYKKSFEHIKSKVAVVTNIEADHMDCYSGFSDLQNSFVNFINNSKTCVINCDNNVIETIQTKNITLINSVNGYNIKNIKKCGVGFRFDVFEHGVYLGNFKINVMGKYNITNALFAIAVARHFNIKPTIIYDALYNFKGVMRRNEKLGKVNGTIVYADYCHHPTEIKNSIMAFKQHYKNILCVFQPHTYSRTKTLMTEFSTCFKGVKKLVLFKTYAAREEFDPNATETSMFKKVKNKNKCVVLIKEELIKLIHAESLNYNAIIVLGAGDVYWIIKNGLKFD